jgi:hypothetical protein
MNSNPEEFEGLRRLLALKKHENPPPGYFNYLPEQIRIKNERNDLSEHSTWWEWMVAKFDARPVLAGAYAFAISGLMLLGYTVSQDLQNEKASTFIGWMNDPVNTIPSARIANHFANPGNIYLLGTSTDPVFEEPPATPKTGYNGFTMNPAAAAEGH